MAGSRRAGCRRHVDYGDLAAGAAAGGEGAARWHVEQCGAQGGGGAGGGNAAHRPRRLSSSTMASSERAQRRARRRHGCVVHGR
eukprot:2665003-Prymnesium_polylepis.2